LLVEQTFVEGFAGAGSGWGLQLVKVDLGVDLVELGFCEELAAVY
jgi:hypothetical protein